MYISLSNKLTLSMCDCNFVFIEFLLFKKNLN